MSYESTEHDRRIANIVRIGTVAELDEANALVKIDLGEVISEWVPWVTGRAGPDRTWHAPEVGEQVVLLSPSGEISQGVALPSVYQNLHVPPAAVKTTSRTEFADGAFIQYDRAGHLYNIDVPSSGKITLHVGASTLVLENADILATIGSTTLKLEAGQTTLTTNALSVVSAASTFSGDVTVQGNLAVNGSTAVKAIMSNSKNISSTHTHGGVTAGAASTSVPN